MILIYHLRINSKWDKGCIKGKKERDTHNVWMMRWRYLPNLGEQWSLMCIIIVRSCRILIISCMRHWWQLIWMKNFTYYGMVKLEALQAQWSHHCTTSRTLTTRMLVSLYFQIYRCESKDNTVSNWAYLKLLGRRTLLEWDGEIFMPLYWHSYTFTFYSKDVYHCRSIISDVFVVYSAKK